MIRDTPIVEAETNAAYYWSVPEVRLLIQAETCRGANQQINNTEQQVDINPLWKKLK